MRNKKGLVATGLTTMMLYFGFALMIILFYFIFRLTLGETEVKISGYISNTDINYQILNYLRTPIVIDGRENNIADLIALSNLDTTKKSLLEKTLQENFDNSFGTANCVVMCINGEKFKGSGCGSLRVYTCPINIMAIPDYKGKLIDISLDSNAQSINSEPVS